ncbi:hypothetical protein [Parasitella parasitica]|uniref:SAP domain-containing protein n=1 Tax=Parasitella parasitica TaxID=35722 RepID=A0A0B7MYG4_9FUNG|nr:hypothetical protein [Parasitella parasitica]
MFNRSTLQKRAFHYSSKLYEEWTKAGLRRMKKNDLVDLAKENHLDISGTKNDIIIQLLSHQTAKIVGSTTPTLHSIRKVVDKSDEVPEDVVNAIEADNEWMKAFEMKVAQRGSRKPMTDSRDHFTSSSNDASKPHPFNDAVKTNFIKPAIEQVQSTSRPSTTFEKPPATKQTHRQAPEILNELEGMDPAWVDAFELKVGSRGARHHLTDTLSPSTPTLSAPLNELPFIKVLKSEKEDRLPAIDEKAHKSGASNNKNAWISAMVGTGMLAWYFGGEQGLSTIWHFLTASASS